MLKPICVSCQKEMKCHKNGVYIHVGNKQYYEGDQWKCMLCNYTVVSGTGNRSFELPDNVSILPLVDLAKGK